MSRCNHERQGLSMYLPSGPQQPGRAKGRSRHDCYRFRLYYLHWSDQDTISSFISSSSSGWSGLMFCPRPLEDSWSLSLNLDLHSCTKIFSRIVQGSKCKPVSVYTPTFLRLVNFTGNSSHVAGYSKEKSYPRVSTDKGRTGRFSQSSVEMSNDPARKHSGV